MSEEVNGVGPPAVHRRRVDRTSLSDDDDKDVPGAINQPQPRSVVKHQSSMYRHTGNSKYDYDHQPVTRSGLGRGGGGRRWSKGSSTTDRTSQVYDLSDEASSVVKDQHASKSGGTDRSARGSKVDKRETNDLVPSTEQHQSGQQLNDDDENGTRSRNIKSNDVYRSQRYGGQRVPRPPSRGMGTRMRPPPDHDHRQRNEHVRSVGEDPPRRKDRVASDATSGNKNKSEVCPVGEEEEEKGAKERNLIDVLSRIGISNVSFRHNNIPAPNHDPLS